MLPARATGVHTATTPSATQPVVDGSPFDDAVLMEQPNSNLTPTSQIDTVDPVPTARASARGRLVRELYVHPDAAIARAWLREAVRSMAPVAPLHAGRRVTA
jgi:hypothetical protein